jgi:hypothetical protein
MTNVLGPLGNHLALVLRHGGENVDGELVGVRLSQATKSTPRSMSGARKATLRESRSSFAMASLARSRLHSASAFASSGRPACLPLSTSVNSPTSCQEPPSR